MASKYPINHALLRKLGWEDHNGREVSWRAYVKPPGFYRDEDDVKPRKKNKSKFGRTTQTARPKSR